MVARARIQVASASENGLSVIRRARFSRSLDLKSVRIGLLSRQRFFRLLSRLMAMSNTASPRPSSPLKSTAIRLNIPLVIAVHRARLAFALSSRRNEWQLIELQLIDSVWRLSCSLPYIESPIVFFVRKFARHRNLTSSR